MAGKLAVRTVPEHALNSLCNEQNLVVQPILQNRLSILTLDLKEVTAHTHTHARTKKSILFIYLKKKKKRESNQVLYFFQYHQGHWKIAEKIKKLPGIILFL